MDHGEIKTDMQSLHQLGWGGKRDSAFRGGLLPVPRSGPLCLYLLGSNSMLDMQRHWASPFSVSANSPAQLQQEDGDKRGQEDAEQQGLTTVNGIKRRWQARGIPCAIAEMPDGPGGGPHQVMGGSARGFGEVVPVTGWSWAMEAGLRGPVPLQDIHNGLHRTVRVDPEVQ